MTSGYDQPARSADAISSHPGPGQARGRRAAALLAAAVPLAAAALAAAPAAAAFAAAAPPAVAHARPSQPLAAELLASGALPATTAVPTATDPKLPPYVGD
jgi:hypothetical protein